LGRRCEVPSDSPRGGRANGRRLRPPNTPDMTTNLGARALLLAHGFDHVTPFETGSRAEVDQSCREVPGSKKHRAPPAHRAQVTTVSPSLPSRSLMTLQNGGLIVGLTRIGCHVACLLQPRAVGRGSAGGRRGFSSDRSRSLEAVSRVLERLLQRPRRRRAGSPCPGNPGAPCLAVG